MRSYSAQILVVSIEITRGCIKCQRQAFATQYHRLIESICEIKIMYFGTDFTLAQKSDVDLRARKCLQSHSINLGGRWKLPDRHDEIETVANVEKNCDQFDCLTLNTATHVYRAINNFNVNNTHSWKLLEASVGRERPSEQSLFTINAIWHQINSKILEKFL